MRKSAHNIKNEGRTSKRHLTLLKKTTKTIEIWDPA